MATLLLFSSFLLGATWVFAVPSYSIELEEFRWNRFPLKILVDMNRWSTSNYALSVREALDSWIGSIRIYIDSYGGETLRLISYTFYLSNVNSTSNYDVIISFTPIEMPPIPNTVGLTTYEWNAKTHEPIPPITINITTYSSTASPLFVKNVAMHELGHALGLGHAPSQYTADGDPELMYYSSSRGEVVYPSTLDVYGLTMLYQGNFSQIIQLPSSITYKILSNGRVPPPATSFRETYFGYLIILVILLLALAIILTPRKTLITRNSPSI